MSDNPYEAPRADLTPPGAREWQWAWWQDRLALVATAIVMTILLSTSAVLVDVLGLPQWCFGLSIWLVLGGGPLAWSLGRRLRNRR